VNDARFDFDEDFHKVINAPPPPRCSFWQPCDVGGGWLQADIEEKARIGYVRKKERVCKFWVRGTCNKEYVLVAAWTDVAAHRHTPPNKLTWGRAAVQGTMPQPTPLHPRADAHVHLLPARRRLQQTQLRVSARGQQRVPKGAHRVMVPCF